MTAELLAAIHERPDDDAARAVYADWLIEQGDPRGEFITLQLARAAGTLDEASAKRERALLRKHVKSWTADVARFVSVKQHSLFVGIGSGARGTWMSRGFLAACQVRGAKANLSAAVGHAGLALVEDLSIYGESSDELEPSLAIATHPSLRALRALELTSRGRAETQAIVEAAGRIARLRSLELGLHVLPSAAEVAPVEGALEIPTLERLRCDLPGCSLELTRAPGAAQFALELIVHEDEQIRLGRDAGGAYQAALDGIPRARVASFSARDGSGKPLSNYRLSS